MTPGAGERVRGAAICRAVLAIAMTAGAAVATYAQTALRADEPKSGAIAGPLTGVPGDAARGRAIALDRDQGNCVLCHTLPDATAATVSGNVGPPLAGAGSRLTAGELRLRLVDSTRINPDSVMPAYHRIEGLTQVAAQYRGKPVLDAQQVEDLVVYLQGLR